MAELQTYHYTANYSVPPGEVLQEYLDALGMSQKELALRTGLTQKTVSGIIKAKAPVTPETALKLERVLEWPAHFWSNLEQQFQQDKLREAEHERLEASLDWLRRFPVGAMIDRDWLPNESDKTRCLECLLRRGRRGRGVCSGIDRLAGFGLHALAG